MARGLQHPIPWIESALEGERPEPRHVLTKDERAALETLLRLTGEGRVEPLKTRRPDGDGGA
jgi:hypothetical protein